MFHPFLSQLPLSRYEIDRDHLARDRPGLFEELWRDPATRILPLWGDRALVGDSGGSGIPALALLAADRVPRNGLTLYLGRSTSATSPEPPGTPIVAAVLDESAAAALDARPEAWAGLREHGARLSDRDAGLLVEAVALANWHDSHRFSPLSGEPTVADRGGWVRRDPATGREIFPRTDAAVIVGITDHDDRMLLGTNARWDANRFSLLAGFVEPGESLEAAVRREVLEESGLRLAHPMYLGSQPWPFPASLMLGFTATVDPLYDDTLRPDGTEVLELRWFSRTELVEALPEVRLPGPTSIARSIIETWFGGPLG